MQFILFIKGQRLACGNLIFPKANLTAEKSGTLRTLYIHGMSPFSCFSLFPYVHMNSTYFPISGLLVSKIARSIINGSSGGIPRSGIPSGILWRNFSRNLFSLNSKPFDAALSTN